MTAGDPTNLVRDYTPIPQQQIAGGLIAPSRPGPTGFEDPVWVVLPEYDPDALIGPCGWPAIHGNTLPAPGAYALVAFDDRNLPTVIYWTGKHS